MAERVGRQLLRPTVVQNQIDTVGYLNTGDIIMSLDRRPSITLTTKHPFIPCVVGNGLQTVPRERMGIVVLQVKFNQSNPH